MTGGLCVVSGVVAVAAAAPLAPLAVPLAGASFLASFLFRKDAEKHREELRKRGAKQPDDDFALGAAKRLHKFAPGSGGWGRSLGGD